MIIADGKVDTGVGLVVTPELTEQKFLSSPAGMTATVFVQNGVHHSYKLKNTHVEGKMFLPVLYFSGDILTEAHLHSVTGEKEKWPTYSSQSEAAHKLDNDNWLRERLGVTPPYVFSWGSIESVLDQKAGTTFVLLRYFNEAKVAGIK